MRERPWFAVVYMFAITAFFSSIVIGFAQLTRDRVEANKQLAFEKAVLQVFDLAATNSPAQLHDTFVKRFIEPRKGQADYADYPLFDNGRIAGYAVPFDGKGFWAPIKGVIGISADMKTVTGIAFYEQSETPGLGAEIVKPAFCNRFKGLKISPTKTPLRIVPVGTERKPGEVEAISGATQTCTRLEKLINEDLSQWLDGMTTRSSQKGSEK